MQSSEAGFAVPISTQQAPTASPFAATVQRALSGALSFDAREVPLTKLTQQLSLNLAESRARGSLKQPAKSGTPCALETHRWILQLTFTEMSSAQLAQPRQPRQRLLCTVL